MIGTWQQRRNRPNLIVVACGFAMDQHCWTGFDFGEADVLILHSYARLAWTTSEKLTLEGYQRIDVIAWSLGVWVWDKLSRALAPRAGLCIAVNGTLKPRHPHWGIPPVIFDLTLQRFDATSREIFYSKIWPVDLGSTYWPQRDWQDQRRELEFLRQHLLLDLPDSPPEKHPFTHVIMSLGDAIMPPVAQERFWTGRAVLHTVEATHSPFHLWTSWQALVADLESA